jgi:hypothetical protein
VVRISRTDEVAGRRPQEIDVREVYKVLDEARREFHIETRPELEEQVGAQQGG